MEEKHIRKNVENLELRMYNLVIYNVSGIQAGIQSNHASDHYALEHFNDEDYQRWLKNYKTIIIKNGGTTNDGIKGVYGFEPAKGSINLYYDQLLELGIKAVPFYEPDLNNALTSVSFLVDERVFYKKKDQNYPDWNEDSVDFYNMTYDEWVEYIGGEKNLFLRNVIQPLPLANN